MLTADVIAHFGSRAKTARALGIGKAAVSKWGERVPPLRAAQIQQKTRGKLEFNPDDYSDWHRQPRTADSTLAQEAA